ncbi:hypothetical protein N1851_024156 [Merluccius polli]|uniref:Uncharacterized protein n=1 Tax=Merluccius polli TaxID=89951 RepID=A0AA47MFC3_MERPO|nr:hypothetical protein N1851_024156 [Merluccius polli]
MCANFWYVNWCNHPFGSHFEYFELEDHVISNRRTPEDPNCHKSSYQRTKRQGKITNIPVADLPREKQVQMREKWKQYQRKYRERKRVLAEVLNLTPPSLNSTAEDQLNGPLLPLVDVTDHDYVQPRLERPRASSTPVRAEQKSTSRHRAVLKEREKLRFELIKIRKELKSERLKAKKLQRKVDKLKVKKGKDVSVSNKKRDKKKIAEEKKERVVSFLCRDENSRMLSGKKDTVTKNKMKRQRRVLLHSLKDLHSNYNTTALKHHAISY